MKKEKMYGLAYALVLGLILVGTSLSGQLAYANTTIDHDMELKFVEVPENFTASVNTTAITEISQEIREKLNFFKNKIDLEFTGEALVEVVITKEGYIKKARVIDGKNRDLNRLIESIVADIGQVTPISYDGVAKERVIRIPVKFRK